MGNRNYCRTAIFDSACRELMVRFKHLPQYRKMLPYCPSRLMNSCQIVIAADRCNISCLGASSLTNAVWMLLSVIGARKSWLRCGVRSRHRIETSIPRSVHATAMAYSMLPTAALQALIASLHFLGMSHPSFRLYKLTGSAHWPHYRSYNPHVLLFSEATWRGLEYKTGMGAANLAPRLHSFSLPGFLLLCLFL